MSTIYSGSFRKWVIDVNVENSLLILNTIGTCTHNTSSLLFFCLLFFLGPQPQPSVMYRKPLLRAHGTLAFHRVPPPVFQLHHQLPITTTPISTSACWPAPGPRQEGRPRLTCRRWDLTWRGRRLVTSPGSILTVCLWIWLVLNFGVFSDL